MISVTSNMEAIMNWQFIYAKSLYYNKGTSLFTCQIHGYQGSLLTNKTSKKNHLDQPLLIKKKKKLKFLLQK